MYILGQLGQPTKIFCTGTTSSMNQTREGPLSFVLFESPFASVSTVSRGHPSLAVVGKHPDLMVGQPTSTVFPTNDRIFEISQFFAKNFEKV